MPSKIHHGLMHWQTSQNLQVHFAPIQICMYAALMQGHMSPDTRINHHGFFVKPEFTMKAIDYVRLY